VLAKVVDLDKASVSCHKSEECGFASKLIVLCKKCFQTRKFWTINHEIPRDWQCSVCV